MIFWGLIITFFVCSGMALWMYVRGYKDLEELEAYCRNKDETTLPSNKTD